MRTTGSPRTVARFRARITLCLCCLGGVSLTAAYALHAGAARSGRGDGAAGPVSAVRSTQEEHGAGTARDTLGQTSVISALLEGVYEGDLRVGALRQRGDFGLGTLNALDGEMVQVDGQVFQVRSDGKVRRVPDDALTPFAVTTFFEADRGFRVEKPLSFREMTTAIDAHLPSRNIFYAIRIEGVFAAVRTRSVARQTRPYRHLAEVTKTQSTFSFHNQRGVMVGFWTPTYAASLNVPGYHFHFLTADRTGGGHVLDCNLRSVQVSIDDTPYFRLDLPSTPDFRAAVLPADSGRELKKSEKQETP